MYTLLFQNISNYNPREAAEVPSLGMFKTRLHHPLGRCNCQGKVISQEADILITGNLIFQRHPFSQKKHQQHSHLQTQMAASKWIDGACVTILTMTQWLIHFMKPSINPEIMLEQWVKH